jgi:exopolysaccharide production protein ExoQ
MANDGLAIAAPRARFEPFVAEAAYLAFLLLVFVGLSPFETRDPASLAIGVPTSGAGDLARQICYLGAFAAIVWSSFAKRGWDLVKLVPVSMALLLLWCVLSATWAGEPSIALRRAGLEIVIVVSALLSIDTIGADRALTLWRYVLIGVLIVNWISIPLLPQAIHQAGEADPSLVGDWRGLYFHKNIAGSVCAISALIFLYWAIHKRSLIDWAFAAAAVVFLVMTHSKASMAFLPVAIVAGAIYRIAWKRDLDRYIVAVFGALLFVLAAGTALVHADAIARLFENAGEFTGRAAIWQAEAAYIAAHPLLGSGFGTFSDTGSLSPLYGYFGANTSAWVQNVAHGHNGYLQILVTIGGIGFVLAIAALIVKPALAFWPRDEAHLPLKSLLLAMFVFILFHNLLESDFLEGDGVQWVAFLLMFAMLQNLRPKPLSP